MTVTERSIQRVERERVQTWLPLLDDWLLEGAVYGVQHTWPQLYRRDGGGAFFVVTEGDRLLSHCAVRVTERVDAGVVKKVALLGSVATDPLLRGRGLATEVLRHAVAATEGEVDAMLLWAEREQLYERAGFVASGMDRCLTLARTPRRAGVGARLATIADHAALHALHRQKPTHIVRSEMTMSTLLTTPGMSTVVLERDARPVAYACCGKGADLRGHWHELGGSDDDLALLLPAAMHVVELTEAALLLPPYRARLRELLDRLVVDEFDISGPMVRSAKPLASHWIDGLDSV